MEIQDPKLKKAIMELPGAFNNHVKYTNRRLSSLEDLVNVLQYVELTNGDGNRVKVSKIIPAMHQDIKKIQLALTDLPDIKNATEFLVDFNKLHKLLKKYKIYWLFLTLSLVYSGLSYFEVLKLFIRQIIH